MAFLLDFVANKHRMVFEKEEWGGLIKVLFDDFVDLRIDELE